MLQFIFLFAILCLRVVQGISSKVISNAVPQDFVGLAAYKSVGMGISAVFAAILILFDFSAEAFTSLSPLGWLIACATGITVCTSSVCSMLALKSSSITLTSLFSMAGLLIPTVSGIFIFGQSVTAFQWLGVLLLILAALLLASSSQKTNGRISAKTVFLLFSSMLANGTTMLLQALYKKYVPGGSVSVYSFLQFTIPSLVLCAIGLPICLRQKRRFFVPNKKLMLFTVLSSGALFGISQSSTVACAVIPIAVLFPVSDGGGMVISALVAHFIYKEKLNTKSMLGVTVGIAAIILMKLFSS